MTVLQEPPIREVTAQPTVAPPVTPVKRARIWPRIVAVAAVLLAFGVGLGIGLFVVNGDIDSLQDDVAALQTDLQAARDQVGDLRMDVIMLESGYSLEREHLAQAPDTGTLSLGNLNEHLAQAPDTGTLSLGNLNEHLAQAPDTGSLSLGNLNEHLAQAPR